MHGSDEVAPAHQVKERKNAPKTLGECLPGDVVKLANGSKLADGTPLADGSVVQITARIWGTPMGRVKVDTEFGWGELLCMDAGAGVAAVVQWAR